MTFESQVTTFTVVQINWSCLRTFKARPGRRSGWSEPELVLGLLLPEPECGGWWCSLSRCVAGGTAEMVQQACPQQQATRAADSMPPPSSPPSRSTCNIWVRREMVVNGCVQLVTMSHFVRSSNAVVTVGSDGL